MLKITAKGKQFDPNLAGTTCLSWSSTHSFMWKCVKQNDIDVDNISIR